MLEVGTKRSLATSNRMQRRYYLVNDLLHEPPTFDNAPGLEESSRLGCQCVPNGKANVVVEVPDWNRNLVREEH